MNIGIIGGGIRGELFASALAHRTDVQVVAVADPARERLTWASGIDIFPDHDSLLEGAKVDALIVATPDFAHFDAVSAAAGRGIPLLVEKPLATDLEEALELERRCSSVPVMVGFENRWNPLVRGLHAAATESGPVSWQHIELSNTVEVPLRMLGWAGKSSPAWFLLPHTVDLAMWVAGDRVTSVDAVTGHGHLANLGVDTIDWIQATMRFASGSTCQLTSSWILPDGTEPIVEFRYTSNAPAVAVRADVIRGTGEIARAGQGHAPVAPVPVAGSQAAVSAPAAMVGEFVDRLLAGEPLSPGIAHGTAVTRIIAGMLRSAGTGQPVRF